jgi:hypothetical protein
LGRLIGSGEEKSMGYTEKYKLKSMALPGEKPSACKSTLEINN